VQPSIRKWLAPRRLTGLANTACLSMLAKAVTFSCRSDSPLVGAAEPRMPVRRSQRGAFLSVVGRGTLSVERGTLCQLGEALCQLSKGSVSLTPTAAQRDGLDAVVIN
jgi:hypothetical protein